MIFVGAEGEGGEAGGRGERGGVEVVLHSIQQTYHGIPLSKSYQVHNTGLSTVFYVIPQTNRGVYGTGYLVLDLPWYPAVSHGILRLPTVSHAIRQIATVPVSRVLGASQGNATVQSIISRVAETPGGMQVERVDIYIYICILFSSSRVPHIDH